MELTEDQEQQLVVEYLEARQLKFTAIPNHTWTPSIKQKMHNVRLGVRPGLPDLLIVLPNRGLLFIEMKRGGKKPGYPTPAQVDWVETLDGIPGVAAHICRGAEEAIKTIESYLPITISTQPF